MNSDPRVELISDKEVNVNLTDYYTKTQVNNLIPTVPTALSQLTTDTNNQRVSETEKANLPTSVEKIKITSLPNFSYFV